jgi:hypothetical protein
VKSGMQVPPPAVLFLVPANPLLLLESIINKIKNKIKKVQVCSDPVSRNKAAVLIFKKLEIKNKFTKCIK